MQNFLKKSVLIVLLVFSTMFVFAQEEDSEWYWDKPISEITFEGLKNVKKSDLTGITSSFIGFPFDEETYNDLLDRLYALDLFDEIEPYAKHAKKDGEVKLVFQVTERPVIHAISFSGNKEIRNGEFREKINSKVSDVYVESKILVDERVIREYYISKGFTEAQVSHTVTENNGEVNIVFKVSEGSQVVISSITIQGNTIASEKTLKSKMKLKEVGFLKDGFYQKSTMENDKQIILSYYQERGYMDANFIDVVMTTSKNEKKNRNELSIKYIIYEGLQYTFTGVKFVGNEVFPTEQLQSFIKLKEGAVFNFTKFQENLMEVTNLYMENGYMSLEFAPVPYKDSDRHEISYTVNIREKSRSHVENIIINGNNKTKDFVIRREIPLEPGDVFTRDKVISAFRNLTNLQFFSSVIPEYQSGSEENLVDLVFSVEEQSTTTFNFGLTFSASGMITQSVSIPFSLFAKLENSNLFGEGRSVSVGTNLSATEQSIDLSYGQNWIGNLPISFSQSLSLSHSSLTGLRFNFGPDGGYDKTLHYMAYESWGASIDSAVGKRWSFDYAILSLTGGLGIAFTRNNYNEGLFIPVDYNISQYANRFGLNNSLWAAFSVDNRDINYDPSKGWFASERLTWNGLIPKLESEFFLRSETKLEAYLTLFDFKLTDSYNLKSVLSVYTGFSNVFQASDFLGEGSMLSIDGMFVGRGWSDLYYKVRGKSMLANNIELRIPFVPGYIGGDLFFDSVAVKKDIGSMFSDLSINDFYFSFGPGIKFLIPQFPLHLLFAWKFKCENGQIKWADQLLENPGKRFQFVLSFNIVNR